MFKPGMENSRRMEPQMDANQEGRKNRFDRMYRIYRKVRIVGSGILRGKMDRP